jgi:hypothetical protein
MKLTAKIICLAIIATMLLSAMFSCGRLSEGFSPLEDTSDTVAAEGSESSSETTADTDPDESGSDKKDPEDSKPEGTNPEGTTPEGTNPEGTNPEEPKPEEPEPELPLNEADDIATDKFEGASDGYETIS